MPSRANTTNIRGLASFLRSIGALGSFFLLLAAPALAGTNSGREFCGNGFDDMDSGYTKGSCPAGWFDAAWSTGCDLKCPAPDADGDGYTSNGSGEMSTGSAVVNGAQASKNEITVDITWPAHNLLYGKRVQFYDSISGSTVTRNVIGATLSTVVVDGAPVTVADNAAITAVTQIDCDDNNKLVYPGIDVADTSCGSNGWKTCQPDGTYTVCSNTVQAQGSTNLYIDAVNGNDTTGTGTAALPWKTLVKLHGQTLNAGTYIYLSDGTYSDVHSAGGPTYSRVVGIRNNPCTAQNRCVIKNRAGAKPIVNDSASTVTGTNASGTFVFQNTNFWHLEGLEIDGDDLGVGGGMVFWDSSGYFPFYTARNMYIHNKTGSRDNGALLYVSSANGSFQNLGLHDYVGNSGSGGDNNAITFFSSFALLHSTLFSVQTDPTVVGTNHCYNSKHAYYYDRIDIIGGSFHNCGRENDTSFLLSGPNTRFENNKGKNWNPVALKETGGDNYIYNVSFSKNTIEDVHGFFLTIDPHKNYDIGVTDPIANICDGNWTIQNLVFEDNVVKILNPSGTFIKISEFKPDTLRSETLAALSFSNNHYWDGVGSLTYCVFCVDNGDTSCAGSARGLDANGTTDSFATMQSNGYEASSQVASITWDSYMMTTNSTRGWLAGVSTIQETPIVPNGGFIGRMRYGR